MGLETATNVDELNSAWPLGSDPVAEADNHLRLIKAVLKNDLRAIYPYVRIKSFQAGALVTAANALLDESTNKYYHWNGAYPPSGYIVPAGSTPATAGGIGPDKWVDIGNGSLEAALAGALGVKKVGNAGIYVNTVAGMLSLNLAVGDVVHLGGYNNILDNSAHTRVIASSDDGSGVQLTNNLWANIVHNGEVDFSWSGALPSDADVSAKLQKFIDKFAEIAVIRVKELYTLTQKVRAKQGLMLYGPDQVNGLNVGGLGETATPPVHPNGFILKSINGWAFDTSIYKKISGNWVRQDDFIGKAGEIFDGTVYRAVNNVHIRQLQFISADVLDGAETPSLETFGAVNLNGSNGSTFKGNRVIGTVLGVCVSGSWGHLVEENLLQCKLCEYLSYWCSWTKAHHNYCSSYNSGLDWNTRFAQYASKLPVEMTQTRGFAAGQSPFGKTITNMISINSATFFEDNFTERGILGYGIEDQDTHWVPVIQGGSGEFHTILLACRTSSAFRAEFDFVANVTHLFEIFETKLCNVELVLRVNRPSTYTNVFNYLQGPSRPFLILKGINRAALDNTSAGKVMRSEYIDGANSNTVQNVDIINGTEYWSDGGPNCGVKPISAINGSPLRNFGNAGCVPIKVDVAGVQCYGVEVFAGTSLNLNGKTGTMRLFYHHANNTFYVQGFDSTGALKTGTISMT